MGNQRLDSAFNLLQTHVTCFRPVCDLVNRLIYIPFHSGAKSLPVITKQLAASPGESYLAIMERAIDESADVSESVTTGDDSSGEDSSGDDMNDDDV